MAVLPTTAAVVMSSIATPAFSASSSVRLTRASPTQRRRVSPSPSRASWIREITSAPYWLWGLRQLASASWTPVSPSRR